MAFATLTGNETLYVLGQNPAGKPAATTEITTTSAIAALASNFSNDSPTNVTAAVGTTLTAAQLITGLLNRSGPTANFTDTTDTAVDIVAAVAGVTGTSFYIDIKNTTPFTQTLTGGTGVTFSSSPIVPPNSIAEYLVVVSNATTVVFNHIFTTNLTPTELGLITTLSTVGAGTITGAGIAGCLTQRTGAQSATAFTDTTDTAANIITAQLNVHIGTSWIYIYQNTTNGPATITGGAGVTVSGIATVPANGYAEYLVTYTAAATITMVGYEQGYNAQTGTFTANGATGVTVTNAAVSPNSIISFTLKTVGGTVSPNALNVKTITPGTGFTVAGTASDTSVYNYEIRG